MATTISQEYQLMHALWRKALEREQEGITIPCGSQPAATRLRFALYASVRQFRKGLATPDQRLADAISSIAISYSTDKCSIRMLPKLEQGLMPLLRGIVGEVPTKSAEELAAEESLARFAGKLMEEQADPTPAGIPAHPTNPYYTR